MENWFRSDKGLLRTAYGFDDVSLVPGEVTIDPKEVDITTTIGGEKLDIPILGAAMDGVIDPRMAVEIGRLGGWGVLNLEGLFTRYDDPYSIIEEIVSQPGEKATDFIQEVYRSPIKEHLVGQRIQEIKKEGGKSSGFSHSFSSRGFS